MKPAAEKLKEKLQGVTFAAPQIPLVNNIDVAVAADADGIREALYRQAFGPVRWVECVQAIKARGVTTIVECGPGKVLAGLVKRIDPELTGQVALVTGASRGIGAAIALELAQKGLKVIGTATSDDGAAKISQVLAGFSGCSGKNPNVNDAVAAEALIDTIVKEHGGLQVLVNNAGITRDMLAMRLKDDDWDA
eukprot:gene9211-11318_t